jgi:hypothetical protein
LKGHLGCRMCPELLLSLVITHEVYVTTRPGKYRTIA